MLALVSEPFFTSLPVIDTAAYAEPPSATKRRQTVDVMLA